MQRVHVREKRVALVFESLEACSAVSADVRRTIRIELPPRPFDWRTFLVIMGVMLFIVAMIALGVWLVL